MPSAICNTCGSLVHYRQGHIKKQACGCGSSALVAVKGTLNPGTLAWEYTDRHGMVRKTEPVFHETQTPIIY